MVDDTEMIPQRRILVGRNLGPVHMGDHVVVVADLVIAVDTSRRLDAPDTQRPQQPNVQQRRTISKPKHSSLTASAQVNQQRVLTLIREQQPITSMAISDFFGFARGDKTQRGRVKTILKQLIKRQNIRACEDGRTRFSYEVIPQAEDPQASQANLSP